MKRTAEDARKTRLTLLDAALSEFTQRGYDRATLQGIAKRAGLTRGAVYHHFSSKAEVFTELVRLVAGETDGKVQDFMAAEGPPRERLKHVLSGIIHFSTHNRRHEAIVRLIQQEMVRDDRDDNHADLAEVRQMMLARHQSQLVMLSGFLSQCQAGGLLREGVSPEIAADALLAYQYGIFRNYLVFQEHRDIEQLNALIDLLLASIFID